jgi:hypothetical protein
MIRSKGWGRGGRRIVKSAALYDSERVLAPMSIGLGEDMVCIDVEDVVHPHRIIEPPMSPPALAARLQVPAHAN